MILGIMQPYIFPYIGYWQLINYVDHFVFFDIVKYNKKSWMNRNRIIHPDPEKSFQYLSIPIKKHDNGALINEVQINADKNWQAKILGQLTVYKNLKAPFFTDVLKLISDIVDEQNENTSFLNFSILSIQRICDYLNIQINYTLASSLDFNRKCVFEPGDWALEISKALNADVYVNPYGGFNLFDPRKYKSNNIDLRFLKPQLPIYPQGRLKEFTSGLSIIDLLMFNSPEDVQKVISLNFEILSKEELERMNYS